jgi:hypothetical protein
MALVRSIGRNADGLPGVAAEIEVSEGNDDPGSAAWGKFE